MAKISIKNILYWRDAIIVSRWEEYVLKNGDYIENEAPFFFDEM